MPKTAPPSDEESRSGLEPAQYLRHSNHNGCQCQIANEKSAHLTSLCA